MLMREIIGQEAVKREMCRSVQQGRIPHAQLLSGAAGIGKLPLALAYAQYIACPHRSETDACGVCPTCLQYSKLQHPDLHIVFPIVKAEKGDTCDAYLNDFREMVLARPYCDTDDWNEKLKAEKKQCLIYEKESSEIQRKLALKAFGDGYKIMIIWQPEKMNTSCTNKLLKLLEEPPEMTLFLLVSEHPEELLPTIVSRLRPLPVPRLRDEQLIDRLTADGTQLPASKRRSYEEIREIARLAKGSYREALRIIDSEDRDKEFFEEFCSLMRNAWRVGVRRDYAALQQLNTWAQQIASGKNATRERQTAFLQYAQRMLRENFIYNYGQPEINYLLADEKQFAVKFAPFINERNIEELTGQFSTAERQITQNANARMVFFDLCLQCIVLIKR